jgi:hypothetical protein
MAWRGDVNSTSYCGCKFLSCAALLQTMVGSNAQRGAAVTFAHGKD